MAVVTKKCYYSNTSKFIYLSNFICILGVALGFNAQFDEAVNALNDAINVLEKRVANLKEKKESRGKHF